MPRLDGKSYSYDKKGMAEYKKDKKKKLKGAMPMRDGGKCRGAGKATSGTGYKGSY